MPRYRLITIHLPGVISVARLSSTAQDFETIYNSFLWRPDSGWFAPNGPGRSDPYADLRYLANRDPMRARSVFRPATGGFPIEGALIVTRVLPVGSADISFSGLGEAVDATAEICDPLRRRQRREQLRHDEARNREAEKGSALDNQLKSLSVVREQIAVINNLVNDGYIDRSEAEQAIRNLLGAQDRSADALERRGVELLAVEDDNERTRD